MPTMLILWSHALAALLFGALALAERRRRLAGWPHVTFVVALALTALWALAVAGIDAGDVSTRIAEAVRNIAWLVFMLVLARRGRATGLAIEALYTIVIVLTAIGALLAIAQILPISPADITAIAGARLVFRMMAVIGALVLVQHLHQHAACRGGVRLVVAALAAMWATELLLYAMGYLDQLWPSALAVVRGVAMTGVAATLAIARHRDDDWTLTVSRGIAMRILSVAALLAYTGITVLATNLVALYGGDRTRLAQTAIVFGATAALLALLSTPWLRAWTKVMLAKHLFRHRYDYRSEWQRFTATLGTPGPAAEPLDRRIIKAIADLTDSPGGLLLVPDGTAPDPGLGSGATWNWRVDAPPHCCADLARHLASDARIVELDAVRNATASRADIDTVPAWMLALPDAWAIVPLVHGGSLVGAIVLARPPVARALDWEDFDLLHIAGLQAASYLAEDRAHAALADAQRFDEFNRRFAFILHDIKNLVSQLTLVARNAERHADNPDFRADMVATLKDSSDRMNALLARLSQHNGTRAEPVQPVDIAALLARVAAGRRAQHPVEVSVAGAVVVAGHPARLEQVLGHLVQNAIEASAPDAPVWLSAAIEDGRVVIAVVDRGCGMAPGFVRDSLFRPFVSSKATGFGIGAFEARQLVDAMHGSIAVDSREGEGTCFRILLPVAETMEMAA